MGAFKFTPGPIHMFARFRDNSTAAYLGTCVTAPEPEAEIFEIPVMNDLAGRSVPFQVVQDGEEHMVMGTFNRFDMTVWRRIKALGTGLIGNASIAAMGSETGSARGQLKLGLYDFELVLINTYAAPNIQGLSGTPGNLATELNAGRRYYSASRLKHKESTVGTRVQEIAFIFKCRNIFNPSTRGFALYSETDLGALGAIS